MRHPGGPLQHGLRVLLSQVRRQPGDPAQVQPAVAEHLEQHRVLPGRPRHGDPQIGLVLPQAKDSPAVLEHRGARPLGVQASELHLADVSDDLGLDAPRLLHEVEQLTQKVLVSDTLQAQHGDSLGES